MPRPHLLRQREFQEEQRLFFSRLKSSQNIEKQAGGRTVYVQPWNRNGKFNGFGHAEKL